MAQLIKTTGEVIEISPENGKKFTCQECYKLIGCELVELVSLKKYQQMICDEEGMINGSLPNPEATRILRESFGPFAQVIYGNVIVCKNREF